MTVNWDDLKAAYLVGQEGSLAAAAAHLGVNYTTIARRIARAEGALGQKLFERLPDGYRLTEVGKLATGHINRMEEAEHSLLRALSGVDQTLSGPLTITAPQLLIAHVLAPMIDQFCAAHPSVDLRVRASNDLLNLNRREADLAVRISNAPGDTLIGQRLTAQHNAFFATPERVAAMEADRNAPSDWLLYDQVADLPDVVRATFPKARVRLRFDDMVAMQGAAQAGLGAVRMPLFLGRATPGLQQLRSLEAQKYMDIWVVGHPDVWPGAKVAAFRNLLVRYVRAHQAQFVA